MGGLTARRLDDNEGVGLLPTHDRIPMVSRLNPNGQLLATSFEGTSDHYFVVWHWRTIREAELDEAKGKLVLLEAGTRPEEIAAARARLESRQEELDRLRDEPRRLTLRSPVHGVMTTPRLQERLGRRFATGATICEVEAIEQSDVSIEIAEQDVRRVEPGRPVRLKDRSLPFEVSRSHVKRIAPGASAGELKNTLSVSCRIDKPDATLQPGMTGYARIDCGEATVGEYLADRVLRYARTEFWW